MGRIFSEEPGEITPVDTTGAGDSFIGTLGANLCRGMDLDTCIINALYVATESVMVQGAQSSYVGLRDLPMEFRPPPPPFVLLKKEIQYKK